MTREYKKWKNRSTNKNEQLLKIQHYIKVRLLHDRQPQPRPVGWSFCERLQGQRGGVTVCQINRG